MSEHDHKKAIIGFLSTVAAEGKSNREVFDDWVLASLLALDGLPHVLASKDKKSLENFKETEKKVADVMGRYRNADVAAENMGRAFGELMVAAGMGWEDVLGSVFMDFANPNPSTGQFFTPWSVAKMMAEINRPMDLVMERLATAYVKSRTGRMHVVMTDEDHARDFAMRDPQAVYCALLPDEIAAIEPVRVMDPAVGSGVMLLAAASMLPEWVHSTPLVQYYGVDISQTCVNMCRLNLMLHGLNGYGVECALALSNLSMEAIPEPFAEKYKQAIEANASNDLQAVEAIAAEINSWKQATLFPQS